MNKVIEALKTRRSCRKYTDQVVDHETVHEIVEAGLWAPSAMGTQDTHIVVVQDPALIKRLSIMNAQVNGSKSDPFYGASTVIVVLANADRPTWIEDGSLVLANLMTAAHSYGIGSCWIHRAREVFDTDEGKQLLAAWGLEGNWRGVGNCILGYAADGGEKPAADRKAHRVTYVNAQA